MRKIPRVIEQALASALQQALVSALQQALASALLALGLVCLATQIQRGRVARAWHGASVCSLPRVPQHIVCMRQYAICMYRQQVICVHVCTRVEPTRPVVPPRAPCPPVSSLTPDWADAPDGICVACGGLRMSARRLSTSTEMPSNASPPASSLGSGLVCVGVWE